jgi:glycosyltransferase involved in cell wall biosynthesis
MARNRLRDDLARPAHHCEPARGVLSRVRAISTVRSLRPGERARIGTQGADPHLEAGSDEIAYLVKGWPRRSEIFIASEIYRLEQLGVPLTLHVIRPADEDERHDVVDRIAAEPRYLPPTSSLSETFLVSWLARNARPYLPALGRLARRRPRGLARATGAALVQSVRARKGVWPRKVYVKELLQAAAFADDLVARGRTRHVHAHFAHGTTTVAWLASLMTDVPFSFTGHAKDIYSPSLNPAGLLERKMRAAAFVVTCTETNREHLHQVCPEATVHVVYHGLNADFTELLGDGHGRKANGRLRLLGVGRLVEKKGFDTFVEACGVLRDRGVDFEAVIAGESGAHEPAVRERIRSLALEPQVRLAGPMSQAGLHQEYRRASIFCLPCRVLDDGDRDGIPNVLVEAMACGVPVVTTPVSGIPELVADGENGVLVPSDDAAALAAGLERVARDPALAERLSHNARATAVGRFSGEPLARRMAGLFEGAA